MFHIDFIEPEESREDVRKREDLIAEMTRLLAELENGKKKPFDTLNAADRTYLLGQGYSSALVNNVVYVTERIRVPRAGSFVEEDVLMLGFTSNAFSSDIYARDAIKQSLIASHFGRCAYCETLIQPSQYGDIEHFRPKAGYQNQGGGTLFRPFYFQLAYSPENLFYSCQLCNQSYKQNLFPVIGARFPEVTIDEERPLFINPYLEDPRDFIRFNPLNANAFPFDLVARFYYDWQGYGQDQVASELWADPAKIPGQTDYLGQPISNPEVDEAFQVWLPKQTDPILHRGNGTITLLGLNRLDLIRSRASHLLKLRGVYWAATAGYGPDQAGAQELIQVLISGDPSTAVDAPQYLSTSIDALQTWNTGAAQDVIPSYNALIHAFIPPVDFLDPVPANDSLMYCVLDSEVRLAGQRRVIYLSAQDKVYGAPMGIQAVFLAIDWKEDLDNPVQVWRDGSLRRTTTLRELVEGNPHTLWRTFDKNEVVAVGDYPPFQS